LTTTNVVRTLNVPLDTVWSLLSDFTRSPSPVFPVVVHEEGDSKYNGVGTIRTLTIGKISVMERLEAVSPSKSFIYCILSGSPVKQYLGKFEFSEERGATKIDWSAEFKPMVPLTGWVISIATKRVVNRIIDQVESDYQRKKGV